MGPPRPFWCAKVTDQLLTVPQIAERWSCSERYVWSKTASGELPVIRLGRLVRVRAEDLQRFEAARLDGA